MAPQDKTKKHGDANYDQETIKAKSPMVEKCNITLTQDWFSSTDIYRPRADTHVEFLNCGQKVFAEIFKAIYNAKKSVEIVMWGFDPMMQFDPRHTVATSSEFDEQCPKRTIGQLLEYKARQGVHCKVLVWFSWMAVFMQQTAIGYGVQGVILPAKPATDHTAEYKELRELRQKRDLVLLPRQAELENKQRQSVVEDGEGNTTVYADAFTDQDLAELKQVRATLAREKARIDELEASLSGDQHAYGQYADSGAIKAAPEEQVETRKWVDRALNDQIPNLSYQTRDFNVLEAIAIGKYVGKSGASGGVALGVGATTSHHQKLVLVDYDTRNPRDALAFVMGHNMHRSYWDTKEHYYYAADAGRPVGFIPWQDGSTKVRGSMLFDINDNIVKAWRRERKGYLRMGDPSLMANDPDFFTRRAQIKSDEFSLANDKSARKVMAQFCRTQMQEVGLTDSDMGAEDEVKIDRLKGDQSILEVYKKAFLNTRNFIYIENQYFRYKQLIELIVKLAKQRKSAKEACVKQPEDLYLFVLTNTPNDSMKSQSTYETLKVLGQQQLMPELERTAYHEKGVQGYLAEKDQQHIKDIKTQQDIEDLTNNTDEHDPESDDPSQKPFELEEIEGLKVIIGTLTCDSSVRNPNPPGVQTPMKYEPYQSVNEIRYSNIYIHSKMFMVDDVFFFLGSANINIRSFKGDSESGIAIPDPQIAQSVRKELWEQHMKRPSFEENSSNSSQATQCDVVTNYKYWDELMNKNWVFKAKNKPLKGHITRFWDTVTPYGVTLD